MKLVLIYLTGLVFGVGISISGMSNPAKVLNFFDIAGSWDASLMFVMGGAMLTAMIGYRFVLRRRAPVFEPGFSLPTSQTLDARLIGGAALFGVGWGIAGFCPGGALPALGTGRIEVFAFSGALVAGLIVARAILKARAPRPQPAAQGEPT